MGALLTVLTLAVLQLALALHVRNTVLDAAAEGARFGSFADTGPELGAERTRQLIRIAVGERYAADVNARVQPSAAGDLVVVTVDTPLPLLGLLGPDRGIEVVGHAALESSQPRD